MGPPAQALRGQAAGRAGRGGVLNEAYEACIVREGWRPHMKTGSAIEAAGHMLVI